MFQYLILVLVLVPAPKMDAEYVPAHLGTKLSPTTEYQDWTVVFVEVILIGDKLRRQYMIKRVEAGNPNYWGLRWVSDDSLLDRSWRVVKP